MKEYGKGVEVTVLAGQKVGVDGSVELERWQNPNGDGVEFIAIGDFSKEHFVDLKTSQNKAVLWILRIFTFAMFIVGGWIVTKFIRPIGMTYTKCGFGCGTHTHTHTSAIEFPILSDVRGYTETSIGFAVALLLYFLTFGVAWCFFRPMTGTIVFVVMVSLYCILKSW